MPGAGHDGGRSSVPLDHPNFLYTYSPAADVARREADVILVAGSRLGNLDIPYDKYWGDPAGQKLIQIDIDQRDMGVTRPLALGIVADAKSALEGLLRVLEAKCVKPKSGDDLKRYREASRQWREKTFAKARGWRGGNPSGARDANDRRCVRQGCDLRRRRRQHVVVGAFVPARDAAALLSQHPGARDAGYRNSIFDRRQARQPRARSSLRHRRRSGGFQLHGDAIRRARRPQDPHHRVCRRFMDDGRAERTEPMGKDLRHRDGRVRWDKVADGLGCAAFYVDKLADLEPALNRAREAAGPAVICLRTDRDANLAIPGELGMRFVEVYQGPMG